MTELLVLPDSPPDRAAVVLEIDPHTGNLRLPEGSPIAEQASDYIDRILRAGLDDLARRSTHDGAPS